MRKGFLGLGIAALIALSPTVALADGHAGAAQAVSIKLALRHYHAHPFVPHGCGHPQYAPQACLGPQPHISPNPCPPGDLLASPGHCVFPDEGFHGIVHLP